MKTPVFHVSLNPHPDDKLSDEQMAALAEEYMERMGYGDQPYYLFKHRDIDRVHYHVVSVRVREDGTKIDDYREGFRSKPILRELERKYGLKPFEYGLHTALADLKKVDYTKGNTKQQIASAVRLLTQNYKFTSLSELRALLGLYNVHMEEINGEAAGKPYRGLVYSAMNERAERIGLPIKSSKIGKDVGIKRLERLREKNKELITPEIKAAFRDRITRAMHSTRTQKDFIRCLKEMDVAVLFRENAAGRIYGVTFVDHNTRTVLNGSRLGKSFSANVFEELFHNPKADREALLPPLAVETAPANVRRLSPSDNHPESSERESAGVGALDMLSGALLDDTLSVDELDEIRDSLQRKYRKKKKKRSLVR